MYKVRLVAYLDFGTYAHVHGATYLYRTVRFAWCNDFGCISNCSANIGGGSACASAHFGLGSSAGSRDTGSTAGTASYFCLTGSLRLRFYFGWFFFCFGSSHFLHLLAFFLTGGLCVLSRLHYRFAMSLCVFSLYGSLYLCFLRCFCR